MLLTTPQTIRTLQRKLYTKAKQETVDCYVLNFGCIGATSSAALTDADRANVHALV